MDMAKRAEEFREVVSKLGPRGQTTPYPKDLRDRAVEYARERRVAGATWEEVAGELGLKIDSLIRWAGLAEEPYAGRAFRQVVLKQQMAAVASVGKTLVLHGPGGFRVEGLDVATAAELLRRLS